MQVKATAIITAFMGVALANATALERRAGCAKYFIVNTRGTGELQGQSSGFRVCNAKLEAAVPGGTVYATHYAASFSQISTGGTIDIVRYVNQQLSSDPSACFVLEGYSQGAMATVNALPKLTNAFNAIKAVMLIGNPARGLEKALAPNIDQWKSKVLDICAKADPVCIASTPDGPSFGSHLGYIFSVSTQNEMSNFAQKQLQSGGSSSSSAAAAGGGCGASAPASPASGGLAGLSSLLPKLPGLKRLIGLGGLGGALSPASASSATAGGAGCSAASPSTPSPSGGLGGLSSLTSIIPGLGGGASPLSALTKLKRDDTMSSTKLRHKLIKRRRTIRQSDQLENQSM